MMRDEDIEATIRQYRVPGPPSSLRGKAVAAARLAVLDRRDHFVWWSAAAGVLLTLTLGLQSATGRMIAGEVAAGRDVSADAARNLAAILGDGPSARYVADRIIAEQKERAARSPRTALADAGEWP